MRASLVPVDAEAIAVAREDDSFVLQAELPAGKVARSTQVNRIPRLFATLDFDDVRAAGDAAETGAVLSAETADGVTIRLAALAGDGSDTWVRIGVEGSGEAAEALRERTKGYEFALSSYEGQVLDWTLDDLTEDAES